MQFDPSVDALEQLLAGRSDQRVLWTPSSVARRLGGQVLGQERAIDAIAPALAIGLTGLARRAPGPLASFLFAGPTGCGKTELARAMRLLSGPRERAVIRLDMSEYADQTSISRLIGSNRGYVGYGDTTTLITTQVRRSPDAVVIFDEVEKSHPTVLPLLLQILDRGTLTDGHGIVARFDRTIVVLTSNIGAAHEHREPVGFLPVARGEASDRVGAAVRAVLAPELIGRLDAVVAFEALDDGVRRRIARWMVDRWVADVTADGWSLDVDDDVVDVVVARSDPRYGARPLGRVIERDLVLDLVGRERGRYRARVIDEQIVWLPVLPDGRPFTTTH